MHKSSYKIIHSMGEKVNGDLLGTLHLLVLIRNTSWCLIYLDIFKLSLFK